MGIFELLVGSLTTLVAGGTAAVLHEFFEKLWRTVAEAAGIKTERADDSYAEKMSRLTAELAQSSAAVDEVLRQMSQVAIERTRAIQSLEAELDHKQKRSAELEQRVKDLEAVPLPVADRLAELLKPGEKKNALRDYLLFAAGVVLSTLIAIGLKLLGWA